MVTFLFGRVAFCCFFSAFVVVLVILYVFVHPSISSLCFHVRECVHGWSIRV